MGPTVLTAEHRPLGKYRQAVKGGGPRLADGGIGQDPVVEGDVDAVVIPVKGHRLHIDIGMQQLGAPHPGPGAAVQQGLGAFGQIDPQILDAVLIPAGVGDLPGVNGHGLVEILGIAAQGVLALFRHMDTS